MIKISAIFWLTGEVGSRMEDVVWTLGISINDWDSYEKNWDFEVCLLIKNDFLLVLGITDLEVS